MGFLQPATIGNRRQPPGALSARDLPTNIAQSYYDLFHLHN